jgi:transposase InsO family protein
VITAFISTYKSMFGVEPICRVLKDHNVPIAPSTYYATNKRPPSARQKSDAHLLEVIKRVHRENFGVYGIRKIWHTLKREGLAVGRDQVARLMRLAGLRGQSRRKKIRTTIPLPGAIRSPDLVRREWFRDAPDLVWVADFTHVLTREGWAYVSFVQDGFSRRILGFTVRTSKSSELVLRALEQAVNVRQRNDPTFVAQGVIHHSDAGSQYTSLAFSQKLLDHGVSGSIGRVGTAYDNALMESTIGLFKSELIHARQVGWGSRQDVETATMAWVRWFNADRLHSALDYLSPTEFEVAYTHRQGPLGLAA